MQPRFVLETVTLIRSGERVTPEVNKAFNFRDDELEQIAEVRPEAIRRATEDEVAEAGITVKKAEATAESDDDGETAPVAPKAAAPKAGKTVAKPTAEPAAENTAEDDDGL